MSNNISINIEGLCKKYLLQHPVKNNSGNETHELWALRNISLKISKGESVGIIGPNGSGKSTLLKILSGVTAPTSGKVEINGRVGSILDIGAGFHPELTGRENIFLNGQLHGFRKKEIDRKFDEIVSFSGIEKFIDEAVKTYSNGMYLRLAFSIMANLDFDVYLLDEVLSVGDVEFHEKSKYKLLDIVNSNSTVVLVSHEIGTLSGLSKFFVQMKSGEIVSSGVGDDIISNYAKDSLALVQNKIITPTGVKNMDVELLGVDIAGEANEEGSFYRESEIRVSIKYRKCSIENSIDAGFTVSDLFNVNFMTCSPHIVHKYFSETGSGIYTAECKIAANFFNKREFYLNVFFIQNRKEILALHSRVKSFKIASKADFSHTAAQLNNGPTPLAPGFEWELKFTPN